MILGQKAEQLNIRNIPECGVCSNNTSNRTSSEGTSNRKALKEASEQSADTKAQNLLIRVELQGEKTNSIQ